MNDMNESITELHRTVHSVRTFHESDPCVDFLTDVSDQKVALILSGVRANILLPLIHGVPQLESIYILCGNKTEHEHWTKEWRKVKGIFTNISFISDQLKRNTRQCEQNLIPISILSSTDSAKRKLNELDSSFMYSQLLKEILLTIEYDEQAKTEFVEFCRVTIADINTTMNAIDNFERDYALHSPIWWYTKEPFIFSMLNRALRTQDTEIILKMGFFVLDLHRQIEHVQSEISQTTRIVIYRGQGMSNTEFEKMKEREGGLLSFNNFLSTSDDRQVSLIFADSSREDSNITGILFQMEIDPSISSTPFASLDNISYYLDSEKEILFSMHTVFRIGKLHKIEDRLWQVNLTLTSDDDPQLRHLSEYLRDEVQGIGVDRLGKLMVRMGEWGKAKDIYRKLLQSTRSNDEMSLAHIHHHLGCIAHQQDELDNALDHYQESLSIFRTHIPGSHNRLLVTLINTGAAFHKKGDYEQAREHYEQALFFLLKAENPDPQQIATVHNNIGMLLSDQNRLDEALKSFEIALTFDLQCLPPTHPDLATTYNNIGLLYYHNDDYTQALAFYEKCLFIQEKSLPAQHLELAHIHHNMASTLVALERFKEALDHIKKALDIARNSLHSNHPDIARYEDMEEEIAINIL